MIASSVDFRLGRLMTGSSGESGSSDLTESFALAAFRFASASRRPELCVDIFAESAT